MPAPIQTDADVATGHAALEFTIRSLLNRTATAELVTVVTCTNSGGVSGFGFVDVVPLVNQVNGDGSSVPRGTIYRLPYHRIQGGSSAYILDPKPKDIGLAVFCWRDTSAVKADPVTAVSQATGTDGTPPGSARVYDPADGMYFGGFLNGTPTNYVRVADDEIEVTHTTTVTIQAPTINLKGNVVQTGGDVSMAQNLAVAENATVGGNLAVTGTTLGTGAATFTGGVTIDGIAFDTHEHPPGTYNVSGTAVTGVSGPP